MQLLYRVQSVEHGSTDLGGDQKAKTFPSLGGQTRRLGAVDTHLADAVRLDGEGLGRGLVHAVPARAHQIAAGLSVALCLILLEPTLITSTQLACQQCP